MWSQKGYTHFVIILISCILLALFYLIAYHPFKKCFTDVITDNIAEASLSPDRSRILYQDDTFHLIVIDTHTGKKLFDSGNSKTMADNNAYWSQDNSLIFFQKIGSGRTLNPYRTNDFKVSLPLLVGSAIHPDNADYIAPDLRTYLEVPEPSKKVIIHDKNGESWETQIDSNFTNCEWSRDSRFLLLTNDQNTIILDITARQVHTLPVTEAVGAWAPQGNQKIIRFPDAENGDILYLLDCDHFRQTKLTTDDETQSFVQVAWDPLGRYLYAAGSAVYKFDVQHPDRPGKKIYNMNNLYGRDFFISPNGNDLLFTFIREPKYLTSLGRNFFVTRLNLRTGIATKIRIPSYNGDIMWVNPNNYYYLESLYDGRSKHAFQILSRVSLKWE